MQQQTVKSLFDPNQLYEIETTLMPGMLLNASMSQKYKMIIYQRTNGENERFRIAQVSYGKYQIVTRIQGKDYALQVPSGSNHKGERIQVQEINNHKNQYWSIEPVAKGIYTITSLWGLTLDVFNSGTSNDFPVIQNTPTGGKNQLWYIKPVLEQKPLNGFDPNQLYEIETTLMPGMLLNASMSQKYKMIIYQRTNGENERFRIAQVSYGKYQIVTRIQGKDYALQVPSGSNQKGERIQVRNVDNHKNQYWSIEPVAKGIYTIKSLRGLALDVYNSGTSNDIPVIQSTPTGGKNQLWYIKPVY